MCSHSTLQWGITRPRHAHDTLKRPLATYIEPRARTGSCERADAEQHHRKVALHGGGLKLLQVHEPFEKCPEKFNMMLTRDGEDAASRGEGVRAGSCPPAVA